MFQKCPICEGLGENIPTLTPTVNCIPTVCSVCKGEKIISILTGLPPNRIQQFPSNRIQQFPSTNDQFTVIGPHTSPNNFDAKSYIESFKISQNKVRGLSDNTLTPIPHYFPSDNSPVNKD